MGALGKRVADLEARQQGDTGVWHLLLWDVGQGWDDMLDDYGRERIGPTDNIIVRSLVAAENGKPVPDPVRERDRAKADAWLEARRA